MMTALRSWPSWSKQLFQAAACSWGPGGCFVVCWLVDSLYPPPNCGLERTSRFRRWHRPSKDLVSGVWRFFFFVRTTIVASLNGQQDVQCSKVHLLAEKSWTVDDMQGPRASPSNVRGLRPGRPHNLPQVRFLSLHWSLCHVDLLCECHNKAGVGTNLDICSSNSFLVQRICLHRDSLERELRPHWRFLLPVTQSVSLGDEIAKASFGRRAEPNTKIKNRYRYSCRC